VTGRPYTIAVVGDGNATEGSMAWRLGEELGAALMTAGYRLITGGLGGVMEAACRGARRSVAHGPGSIVALLPGHDPEEANEYVDVAIPTGLGHLRNALVAHADALVAIGGGAGTLSEMALAWIHDRQIIAFRVPGWSGSLADARLDDRVRFEGVLDDRVHGVDTVMEALSVLEVRLHER